MTLRAAHNIQRSSPVLPALLLLVVASACSLETQPRSTAERSQANPITAKPRAGSGGREPGCQPACRGRTCGDDGCGGSCGKCTEDTICNEVTGRCDCVPQCGDRDCGPDGCGNMCGTCKGNDVCTDGMCECRRNCGTRQCGDDGCGGSCGTCAGRNGTECIDGKCQCIPDCDEGRRVCGTDGCEGGSCGTCPPGRNCDNLAGLCR